MAVAEGGCLCGAVRYAVKTQPVRITVCHCRFCQRATGAAYHVAPVFDQDDFAFTKGVPNTYRHVSDGSGKAIDIRFCADCGTKLCLTLERFPGTVGVYGGTFDDPNAFSRTSRVSKQIFLASGRHGTIVPPGIDSYWGHALTGDDVPVEPEVFAAPKVLGVKDGTA